MSAFAGLSLFASGPHRFTVEPTGALVVPKLSLRLEEPGSRVIGPLELAVVVTGRLLAESDEALDTQVGAIEEKLHPGYELGILIDGHGREWTEMRFVRFEREDRVDRGRVVSLGYTARFVRLI